MLQIHKCASRAVAYTQTYHMGPRLFSRALVSSSQPHRAAFSLATLTSHTRFHSTSSTTGTQGGTPTTTASVVPGAPAAVKPEAQTEEAALSPAEQAAADAIIARIQGLSPDDQQLILNALQNPTSQKSSEMGGAGIGPAAADMVAAFTCGRCEYRMVKRFSKHAYTKGIVIIQCPNCRVKHLIADNLGWIEDDPRNIEDILREKGEKFVRVGDGDYQVVVEAAPTEDTKPE